MRRLAFLAVASLVIAGQSLAHVPEGEIFGAWAWPTSHLPVLDGDISEWDV